jgi:zinc protease
MTTRRFVPPPVGPATAVSFPPIARDEVPGGLAVWSIAKTQVPVVSAMLVFHRGTAADPPGLPGLASLTADLMDEGAGDLTAIELADAFSRIGSALEIDVGPDATSFGFTTLSRHVPRALELLAEIIRRPHLDEADLRRVRELRLSRLRQLSRTPGTIADRAFISAVFPSHPYGHGTLGTTAALEAITQDDARAFWARTYSPRAATLVIAGDAAPGAIHRAAAEAFGDWKADYAELPETAPTDTVETSIRLVDRPGASQSELRVGHDGPSRRTDAYHALVTLNSLLGGQFSSRINRNLREERGLTYGARTAFDFRRHGGSFSCDTSVQMDATAVALGEILREFEAIRAAGAVSADELDRARTSLTRGYVRNFETAGQLVRAASQLVTQGLDDDTFDRFVPEIGAVTGAEVSAAARRFVRPDDCALVVVGDAERCHSQLEELGRPVTIVTPEF